VTEIRPVEPGTAVASPPVDDAPPATTFAYQPGLDGLRAIGITAVVLFHASFTAHWLGRYGSWLGVDLFFVLSGFLITSLLLREFGVHGRFSLKNFYIRRALRLYPVIVVCVLVAVALRLLIPSSPHSPSWAGISSIAFYYANWARQTTGTDPIGGTFGHLWSLSVEEQFYLAWPFLVWSVLALGGRRRALIVISSTLIAIVATVRYRGWHDALHTIHGQPNALRTNLRVARHAWNIVYYGSFTRSDGLLIGCLLAALLGFHPRVPARWVRTLVGALAFGAIVLDLVIADRVRHAFYPTFLTTWGFLAFNLGVAVVVLHVIYSPRAPLPRALSVAPLVWIGRRSYGIYVAHVIVDEGFVSAHLRSAPWMGVAAAVTLVLAAVSYRYYEAPVLRLKSRFATPPAPRHAT